nr:MAG TPA_asm: hypothetical protein [Caudoviricetes sp.]
MLIYTVYPEGPLPSRLILLALCVLCYSTACDIVGYSELAL